MPSFIKRFKEWVLIKSTLDQSKHKPPLFKEGEVWWCSIGENVGIEASGKGDHFRRPVLVIRKLDAYSFLGAPVTKTNRTGSWYGIITVKTETNTVILAQIRHFDYRRLDKKISEISECEYNEALRRLLLLLNKSPAS